MKNKILQHALLTTILIGSFNCDTPIQKTGRMEQLKECIKSSDEYISCTQIMTKTKDKVVHRSIIQKPFFTYTLVLTEYPSKQDQLFVFYESLKQPRLKIAFEDKGADGTYEQKLEFFIANGETHELPVEKSNTQWLNNQVQYNTHLDNIINEYWLLRRK